MQVDLAWLSANFPDLRDLNVLNAGGFKIVFSAVHPIDGHVVLKLIPNQDFESIRREILAVQQIQSRRVPAILEVGQISSNVGACFWFREQRILGATVREHVQRGPLNREQVLRLGLHVTETLVEAERSHIVHRDVKPDNIICDQVDDFWLIDFGISRHLKLPSQTATIARFGKFTAGYGPVEQFRNIKGDIDARADLFALGVTLYECSTGYNPFRNGIRDDIEALNRIETLYPPMLSPSLGFGDDFKDFVDALMQKRAEHRPATAEEALAWIREICVKEGLA